MSFLGQASDGRLPVYKVTKPLAPERRSLRTGVARKLNGGITWKNVRIDDSDSEERGGCKKVKSSATVSDDDGTRKSGRVPRRTAKAQAKLEIAVLATSLPKDDSMFSPFLNR